jgi:hypothetical protein
VSRTVGAAALVATMCPLAFACSSGGGGVDPSADAGDVRTVKASAGDARAAQEVGDGDGAPTYAPTYSAIYDEVLVTTCAVAFCHSGTDYMIITGKDQGYTVIVNAPAEGVLCAPTGLKRVDPGHPETSLLYLKVTSPPCGSKMPYLWGDAGGGLDPQSIEQIRQWIAAGALNN